MLAITIQPQKIWGKTSRKHLGYHPIPHAGHTDRPQITRTIWGLFGFGDCAHNSHEQFRIHFILHPTIQQFSNETRNYIICQQLTQAFLFQTKQASRHIRLSGRHDSSDFIHCNFLIKSIHFCICQRLKILQKILTHGVRHPRKLTLKERFKVVYNLHRRTLYNFTPIRLLQGLLKRKVRKRGSHKISG